MVSGSSTRRILASPRCCWPRCGDSRREGDLSGHSPTLLGDGHAAGGLGGALGVVEVCCEHRLGRGGSARQLFESTDEVDPPGIVQLGIDRHEARRERAHLR
jgi:hypothetical protein